MIPVILVFGLLAFAIGLVVYAIYALDRRLRQGPQFGSSNNSLNRSTTDTPGYSTAPELAFLTATAIPDSSVPHHHHHPVSDPCTHHPVHVHDAGCSHASPDCSSIDCGSVDTGSSNP